MVILLLFLFNFLSASDSESEKDSDSRPRALSVLTEDRLQSRINGMLHLLDDAERMGHDTNLFPMVGNRNLVQTLREYQGLSQENATEVRNAFVERWNHQLAPLLSGLSSDRIQEAIPMINSFIERTAHEVVSQGVEEDVNNFLNEGTFEVSDDLRDFIAASDVYQGTPRENPILPIENSPHSPLPADENVVIEGLLLQNPQGLNTPPALPRVAGHLLPGSPLREEVNENVGEENRRRNAEEAGLPDRGPTRQRRRLAPRGLFGDDHQQNLPFHRDHDDENGPNGGGLPVH